MLSKALGMNKETAVALCCHRLDGTEQFVDPTVGFGPIA